MIQIGEISLNLQDPLVLGGLCAGAFALLVLWLLVMALRMAGRSAQIMEPMGRQLSGLGQRVDGIAQHQHQLTGGLIQVTDAQTRTQAQMMETMERRLEEVTKSMGDTLHGTATRTARSLGELQTRLETIDKAQANIEKLSGNVLGLQDILSNKQARGAFGEIQMGDIVRKALPPDAYTFQATLSNGKRADCLIHLPDPPGPLVIDSKFPLEPYESLINANSDAEVTAARREMRAAIRAHIKAISEKYILHGETADGALMFVPSEAVYSELHASFPDLVREGFSARVWLVSPTTCMATLNTLRAVLKDVRMREQAGIIRRELAYLYADVERLSGRVDNLDKHFNQAIKDVGEIKISADKIGRRARKMDDFDFEETVPEKAALLPLVSR
ncbi:DNA recombination protein RmuC [Pseudoruegeria sp. SK021]|uniref:DNA recombination protein RmuC n=1 Tax=Pseudoruegeria sp. SK021 TaxID=1933035 RepID=UPI000A253B65|nr:DNA recombination protein RmuC [Pseudoruegeria sp. SK021]OSP55027.1 recombinase RmuC [Pseudoruegeria sp. SK021]